jgi:hypothetical protein
MKTARSMPSASGQGKPTLGTGLGIRRRIMRNEDVFNAVQAALLNSECHPSAAVQAAMLALTQFAVTEAELGEEGLKDTAEWAFSEGPQQGLW